MNTAPPASNLPTSPSPMAPKAMRPALPRVEAPRLPLLPVLDWEGFEGELEAALRIVDSLWLDATAGDRAFAQALELSALKEASTDAILETSVRALLNQALRHGPALTAARVQDPFFRLPVLQRFLLAALHGAGWSYARVSRILFETDSDDTQTELKKLAWAARTELTLSTGFARTSFQPPSGSSGMHCPVYEPTHPWTQTFLDDETPTRTRPFLQTHLMACEPCQHSLDRARRFYYAVEAAVGAAVPGAVATGMRETGALSARENRERRARALRSPT